jgi:hypothetical protein
MNIENTLAFNPSVTESFNRDYTLVPSKKRGRILIENGGVTEGQEIVDMIEANIKDTFLVSKPVFDYLTYNDVNNVCMFDPQLTVYSEDGKATAQGGLLFA